MELFLKLYLPLFLLIYFGLSFIIPTYRTWKQTSIKPLTFGKKDNAHDYIGLIMKFLIGLIFLNVLIFPFQSLYIWLVPVKYLEQPFITYIGLLLIHASLIWIAIAQYQMSTSWRIGIDRENKTELITKGVFKISRNPIFLGMIITVLGIFLITPNMLSFSLTVSTWLVIQIQVRLEEEFLINQHGERYTEYQQRTNRWL